jgi:hypothetical protein
MKGIFAIFFFSRHSLTVTIQLCEEHSFFCSVRDKMLAEKLNSYNLRPLNITQYKPHLQPNFSYETTSVANISPQTRTSLPH